MCPPSIIDIVHISIPIATIVMVAFLVKKVAKLDADIVEFAEMAQDRRESTRGAE